MWQQDIQLKPKIEHREAQGNSKRHEQIQKGTKSKTCWKNTPNTPLRNRKQTEELYGLRQNRTWQTAEPNEIGSRYEWHAQQD